MICTTCGADTHDCLVTMDRGLREVLCDPCTRARIEELRRDRNAALERAQARFAQLERGSPTRWQLLMRDDLLDLSADE
jgi:hypothetical protein